MRFKEFNGIDIDNEVGVSIISGDTKMIARHVAKLKFKSALDIGTGTGFIPIYLKKLGLDCAGTDINPKAVICAKKNALKNKVKINFYVSDLFEKVRGKFDLIIFNPPFGNTKSTKITRYLEAIKSIIPRNKPIISKIAYLLIKKQRRGLMTRFLKGLSGVIAENGKVIVLLHRLELDLIKDSPFKIIDRYSDLRLVLLNPYQDRNIKI